MESTEMKNNNHSITTMKKKLRKKIIFTFTDYFVNRMPSINENNDNSNRRFDVCVVHGQKDDALLREAHTHIQKIEKQTHHTNQSKMSLLTSDSDPQRHHIPYYFPL